MFFRFSRYIVHWYIAAISCLALALSLFDFLYVSFGLVVYHVDRAACAHGQLWTI